MTQKNSNMMMMYLIVIIVSIYYIYYIYIWPQIFNIYPGISSDISFQNKLIWINTDRIDVMSEKDKEWCYKILITDAPNVLGIYVDGENVNKQDVLRQIEIFNMMFKYHAKKIYFKFKPSQIVVDFCHSKNLDINEFNIRRTIKI